MAPTGKVRARLAAAIGAVVKGIVGAGSVGTGRARQVASAYAPSRWSGG